ncbi:conserved exported hypothetical protein [Thiocapsa sp. KS1]|nr:DUF4390 domain-containing protein [Thiocapsa sp. KS1]CRI63518.1 conserved exported hypothetical protein [Thiocapsa sp. KS1]
MIRRSAHRLRRLAPAVLVLMPMLLLGMLAPAAAKDGLRVERVETRLVEGTFVMDALLDYRFSTEALEALENGVPLTILVQIQVRRVGAWLWEDSKSDLQLRYAIRYKPLSERYEVYRLPGNEGRSFVSRDAAIRALGEITGLSLISAANLDPDTEYEVQIRASLDIEELPLPLRPMAYLKPSWKLSSGWSKWPLTP